LCVLCLARFPGSKMPSLEVIATGYNVKKLDPAAYGIKDNEQCVRRGGDRGIGLVVVALADAVVGS